VRLLDRRRPLVAQTSRFAVVGGMSAVVDVGTFNVLHFGAGLGPLTAKTLAVVVATLVSYAGNRYWSFAGRRAGRHRRDLSLFAALNGVGLLIALAVLAIVRYLLGLSSPLALNVLGNGGGILLAAVFRFWAYRTFVFRHPDRSRQREETPAPIPLTGTLQDYAWGSPTALFDLLGREPTGRPAAEYWLGAHPAAPALAHLAGGSPVPLDVHLDRHRHLLGERPQLPLLLKLLAADRPLSLQVHPTRAQAAAGFAREEAAGVSLRSPRRNYRDANHKPELIVALTPFRALAGIRDPAVTLELVDDLDCPPLTAAFAALRREPTADGVRTMLETLLTLPSAVAGDLVAAVHEAARRRGRPPVSSPDVPPVDRAADLVRVLHAAHPGDVGVVAALLCNDVTLRPGSGLFQPAGMLHSYVGGVGVEVMASSDNVLRGGLTGKHVDVPELLRILDPTPSPAEVLRPGGAGPVVAWPVPVDDFELHRVAVEPQQVCRAPGEGARVLLATAGSVQLVVDGAGPGAYVLRQGEATFLPAGLQVGLRGRATVFCAGSPVTGVRAHEADGAVPAGI
jgi:mannose-6-phosphate isomerase